MYINTENGVYELIFNILDGMTSHEVEFSDTYLKNLFFREIKKYINNTFIINCDSSKNRLQIELSGIPLGSFVIYDHVNKCDFSDILYSCNIENKLYVK